MVHVRERGDVSTGELLGGRYRLQERIGEGGMARVYRAEDEMLGRTVAVKMMRGPIDGLGAIERARSETRVLASLNHHGLVTLFDGHISEDDDSYLVMEFVEGITLQERIHRGAIEPAEAASLAVDIAEALHAAHSAGIVHRDIKPSNLLLSNSTLPGRQWRAKIADFGIACLQDSTRLTAPGIMVGTVAYIAPEQARGASPAPSADIYALGLVLLETLTGTRPFADAEGIGAVVARLQGPPEIPDTIDEDWRRLLRGMTAMLPADRPTALEVASAAAAPGIGFHACRFVLQLGGRADRVCTGCGDRPHHCGPSACRGGGGEHADDRRCPRHGCSGCPPSGLALVAIDLAESSVERCSRCSSPRRSSVP